MASAMKPLPRPDLYSPVAASSGEPTALGPPSSFNNSASNSDPSQPPVEFYSTTTAPLRDHEQEPIGGSGVGGEDTRRRKVSGNSISSSVMDRPRPKPSRLNDQATSRPSSFYGIDANTEYEAGRPSGEWQGESNSSAWQGNRNVEELDTRYNGRVEGDMTAVGTVRGGLPPPPSSSNDLQQRRSSFYGLDSHVQPSPPPTGVSTPSRNDPSPARQTQSSHSSSARPQTQHSSGSGSGSYSSHELPNRPRYSQAPYAASRAASLYGISGSANNAGVGGDPSLYPAPAPLLDQSHLQPGTMASLLSHEKTLELYRQNAKKTNDPHVQFEFCAFVMEVVAELEQATAMEKLSNGTNNRGNGNGSEEEIGMTESQKESRRKQKALVTESITLLNKLAQRGHVKSQYFLADCYTQGVGTVKVSLPAPDLPPD
ncbi:hypothetical protein JCM5350_005416 [Sporobolomyces pararoseus]